MTLETALEILTGLLGTGPHFPPDDRRDAIKLGIEALEWIKGQRDMYSAPNYITLPGETTE